MAASEEVLRFEDFPGHSLTVMLFKDVTNSKWVQAESAPDARWEGRHRHRAAASCCSPLPSLSAHCSSPAAES